MNQKNHISCILLAGLLLLSGCSALKKKSYVEPVGDPDSLANITFKTFGIETPIGDGTETWGGIFSITMYEGHQNCEGRRDAGILMKGQEKTLKINRSSPISFNMVSSMPAGEKASFQCSITASFNPQESSEFIVEFYNLVAGCNMKIFALTEGEKIPVEYRKRTWTRGWSEESSWCK